jgi:hypothetical protein
MATTRKRLGRQFLTRALKSFRNANAALSECENRALRRLNADRRAQMAYDQLPDQPAADALIWSCIEALEIGRTFDAEIAQSRRLLGSATQQGELDRLKNSLVGVERFFEELQNQPLGWVASQVRVPPGTLGQLFLALVFAKDLIEDQRRIASETPKRLGATRKVGLGAAELAAIGWLAENVRRHTHKANREVVRVLAEVVLQRTVTDHRVRKAERTRLGREWRRPFRTETSKSLMSGNSKVLGEPTSDDVQQPRPSRGA